ncbi:MAG: hypothetical protein CMK82_11185 [Pseudomonadales bacterium]|uniref:hypothetical protein n=1 Tax=Sphingobium sp. TaxID=1912891 RepID=UPI000C5C437E|nr:hypothetical protein [Sphingobium sp.]MAS67343.1 hypothetical protein [Pseudomonadales bacterium]MBS90839.1 hypothetical protein [Sphingobium sp.]
MNRYRKYRSYGHSRLTSALAAPPLGVVLACAVAVGLIVGLSGCSGGRDDGGAWERKVERDISQDVLDKGTLACRDGVQYFVFYNTHGRTVTPRMKLDGSLYRCSIKQEPQRVVEQWEAYTQ